LLKVYEARLERSAIRPKDAITINPYAEWAMFVGCNSAAALPI